MILGWRFDFQENPHISTPPGWRVERVFSHSRLYNPCRFERYNTFFAWFDKLTMTKNVFGQTIPSSDLIVKELFFAISAHRATRLVAGSSVCRWGWQSEQSWHKRAGMLVCHPSDCPSVVPKACLFCFSSGQSRLPTRLIYSLAEVDHDDDSRECKREERHHLKDVLFFIP